MVRLSIVDAFADRPFAGNRAGVCLLDRLAPEPWMQALAAELGFSETAFAWPEGGGRRLRWFTPEREVDLCGHATLATAHVLWEEGLLARPQEAVFQSRSGRLACTSGPHGITLDFPADPAVPAAAPPGLFEALGCAPVPAQEAPRNRNLLLVLEDEEGLRSLTPDFAALGAVSKTFGYIVTAPASAPGSDYACRYFAPAWGIDEDPATGSIQCTLGPYWAARLGKPSVACLQASRRGARMVVEPRQDRVRITGSAVTVVRGEVGAAARPAP